MKINSSLWELKKQGGTIAGNTRKAIEAKTGRKVVSPLNAKALQKGVPRKKLK